MKKTRNERGDNAGVAVKQQKNTEEQQFVLQYRGNLSKEFVKKLNRNHPVQKLFTAQKLKSCLPSLKASFHKGLKSHMVYELTCNGCQSIYEGKTCRHITTKVAQHAKADSPMGINAIECKSDKTAPQWTILDQCSNLQHYGTARTINVGRPLGSTALSKAYDSAAQNLFSCVCTSLRRKMIRLSFKQFC